MMSWISILTALGLTVVFAYMHIIEGWQYWLAALIVGGSAVLIIVSLIGLIGLCASTENRDAFLEGFRQTLAKELGDIVNWLKGYR